MGDLPWALDALKALGIGGGPVFAVLWWLERTERKACQTETRALLVQVLTVTNQAANAVTAVAKTVVELREGMRDSDAALALLIKSLRKARP